MKLPKKALLIPACLCFFTASSQAALILDFNEVGSNVILTFSGSVDFTGVTLQRERVVGNASWSSLGIVGLGLADTPGVGSAAITPFVERYQGSYVPVVGVTSANVTGDATIGFAVGFDTIFVTPELTSTVLNDGIQNIFLLSGDLGGLLHGKSQTYPTSFAAIGLNAHAPNTLIDLWRVTGTTGTDNLIQFRVNSPVPEPSSTLVLGLSGLALMARRKRA